MGLISLSIAEGVAEITLTAPEIRNALTSDDMLLEIEAVCAAVIADPSVRVAILTGEGPSFSAGGNIKKLKSLSEMGEQAPDTPPLAAIDRYRHGVHRIPRAIRAIEVPLICAINGPAIGAGLDLTLMCDIRIAAAEASFAESFVKLGIVSGTGGAWLLPRAIGQSKAFEMALTGSSISAQEALAFGLVSAVYPADQLMPAARKMAATIARNPAYAVRVTKKLLHRAIDADYDSTLEAIAAYQVLAAASSEHKEAVKRIAERAKGGKA